MARAPTPSVYADDYTEASRRISEPTTGIIIWPNWDTYCKFRDDYKDDPEHPKWNSFFDHNEGLFAKPIRTPQAFAKDRDKKIAELVEEACQPLVRHLLDRGYFTFYSNAYGHGTKGVGFTDNIFKHKAQGTGYFYYLENWERQPKIADVQHMSFGSIHCDEPDPAKSDALVKKLKLKVTQAGRPQPNPPAKKTRRRKQPRTDHG